MILASCDLETTGLDPFRHQILEIAVVLWDTKDFSTPVEELPTFHKYVAHESIVGDPFALSMHPTILRKIADKENCVDTTHLPIELFHWIEGEYPELIDKEGRAKICFTGKNFGSFDLQFLRRLEMWEVRIRAKHRVIDPGTLYFDPANDTDIPDMNTCCKRAELLSLSTKHDAVGDARIVIQLLRGKWNHV